MKKVKAQTNEVSIDVPPAAKRDIPVSKTSSKSKRTELGSKLVTVPKNQKKLKSF